MSKITLLAVALLMAGVAKAGGADEITLSAAPAVVVKTVPEAGSSDVDASVKEIKVTFSKAMKDNSWSWSTASENTFPEL
jgi:hypothetical protein